MTFARGCAAALAVLLVGSAAWAGQAGQRQVLFADLRFQRGFLLSYPDSSKGRSVEAVLHLGDANNVPVWRLCQWATKYSLATAPCTQPTADDLSYENQGKKVLVGRGNSPNRDLILEVRGSAEYGDRARRPGESWPHLLIEQDAVMLRPLDELAGIRFALSLRLLYRTNHMSQDQYDPGLHAAQFQMFFIVRNISPDSPDRNDFFWFGVPFFDSRHDVPPAYMAKDAGKDDATGKFIYTVEGRSVGVTPLSSGQWLTLDADLLPFIRSGLQEAVKRGYLQDGDPSHYAVANVNLGWEIPGTFDAAMQIAQLNFSAMARGCRDSAIPLVARTWRQTWRVVTSPNHLDQPSGRTTEILPSQSDMTLPAGPRSGGGAHRGVQSASDPLNRSRFPSRMPLLLLFLPHHLPSRVRGHRESS